MKGFLLLYVLYICVIVFGRYINQKIKLRAGITPRKNDFRQSASANEHRRRKNVNEDEYDAEQQEDEYEDTDEEISQITRPLLDSTNEDLDMSEEASLMTYKIALKKALMPINIHEWNNSNVFNKITLIIKVNFEFEFEFFFSILNESIK